jgi:hypothetical protein
MKRILCTLILITIVTFSSYSQNENIDLVQSVIGIKKKEAFKSFMILNNSNNDIFWELYDEYELKRKELGKERIELLENYVNKYDNMNEESTAMALKQMITMTSDLNKLIASYSKKIKKSAGAKPAGQFFQLETYITSVVRVSIMENIPLIGEFETK